MQMINPYVTGGHRTWVKSPYRAMLSAFEWHNDTLNIYTHIIPGIVWMYMFFTCGDNEYYALSSPAARSVISLTYFGGGLMGITSGIAHTFSVIDQRWADACWKLDCLGIIAINFGHQAFDGFLLLHSWDVLYWTLVVLQGLFALYCAVDAFTEKSGITWGIVYPALSSTVLTLPNVAIGYTCGSPLQQELAMYSLGCSAFVFVAGGVFYAGKIPERVWNPNGAFNNFNSHVWHHVCIVISILIAYQSIPLLHKL